MRNKKTDITLITTKGRSISTPRRISLKRFFSFSITSIFHPMRGRRRARKRKSRSRTSCKHFRPPGVSHPERRPTSGSCSLRQRRLVSSMFSLIYVVCLYLGIAYDILLCFLQFLVRPQRDFWRLFRLSDASSHLQKGVLPSFRIFVSWHFREKRQ